MIPQFSFIITAPCNALQAVSRFISLAVLALSAATVLPQQDASAVQQTGRLRDQITSFSQQQAKVKSVSQVVISPDGRRAAWSVYGGEDGSGVIYLADANRPDSANRITPTGTGQSCGQHDPVWSPDGRKIAFLSDCGTPGQAELFVEDTDPQSLQPQKLTHLTGFLSHPRWSPDSQDIALLFVESASRTPSPMAAEKKAVGVMDDRENTDVQRIAVTNLRTSETRQITPSRLYVFEYDWSPDGQSFAFTAAPPPGDDNWYIAKLYTELCAKAEPVLIYKPSFQIALPRWSPDGKSIAFIEGLMSDEGGTGGEIYTVPASGGRRRDLTPGRPSSPAWFTWVTNQQMTFTEYVGGSTAIETLDVDRGATRKLWQGAETIRSGPEESSLSIAKTEGVPILALTRMSWSMLPEVWTGPLGQWKQLTHLNSAVQLSLPKFENVTWKSDGFDVQGWLLYPRSYDPAKRYPMLMAVHGGPAWIARPEWRASDFNTTLFTELGYFVFFPNARGSYGQGEKFTQANRRDWGFGDLQDMLSGIDTVVKRHSVDNTRVGILGWSYGGSTAMMAITQTNRFSAAAAGAGAGNWQSYYGQNAIDKWMIPYFGSSVYNDPAAYLKCSAITYVKRAKTPTLILVGERDGEAPPAQSIEFWHALKELNVPVRLVIYADEGHSFFKEADQVDVTLRTVEWFKRYLTAK